MCAAAKSKGRTTFFSFFFWDEIARIVVESAASASAPNRLSRRAGSGLITRLYSALCSCGKLPGGHENCCKAEIERAGKNCASSTAPCFIPAATGLS